MTTLLAIVLCVTLAAYTVAGVGGILLSLRINRRLTVDDLADVRRALFATQATATMELIDKLLVLSERLTRDQEFRPYGEALRRKVASILDLLLASVEGGAK